MATRSVLALLLFASCSTDDAVEPIIAADAATPPDAPRVQPDAAVAPACSQAQLAAGNHDYSISAGGLNRTYHVHVPPGLADSARAPLLLNLHPLVLNGPGQALFSGMNPMADERGFIVVYPDGVSGSWNGGSCCGQAAQQMRDDVGFIRAVVADVVARACIDERRVYATGMSNGGFLAHRLACEASDLIAAIAPAAGVLGILPADCQPARPVPVLHFHGTADTLVDYAAVAPTIAAWTERNGCTGTPREIYREGSVHCEAHEDCAAGTQVVLCTADGGGHCWPGATFCPSGAAITDIEGNRYILDFLSAYALP